MKANDDSFFSKLPKETGGLAFIVFGLIMLVGAWLNWGWIFQGDGKAINMAWISDTFGRTVARVIVGVMGVLIIICGIVLVCLLR